MARTRDTLRSISNLEALIRWCFWIIDGCSDANDIVARMLTEDGAIRTSRAAFELALLDLWARSLNQPVRNTHETTMRMSS